MPRSHQDMHDLEAGPPPEVLLEIAAAWERAQELPEIHFEADHRRRRAFASVGGRGISTCQAVLAACGDAIVEPRVPITV
jgi:hypothetical protein